MRTADAGKYYDDRYRRGYMEEWPRSKVRRVRELLEQQKLPQTGVALDFGCGSGVFTAVLRDALPGWEIHGTDISGEALKMARERAPDCKFHSLAQCEGLVGGIDLVFSHHVLEHVPDLSESAGFVARLMKPRAAMLHILPCGDPGGIEHYVSRMRPDGINHEAGGRFFFEEEGHLRRLTTRRLAELWSASGFRVEWARYANHFFGVIETLTYADLDLEFLLSFADPASYPRRVDRMNVTLLRLMLVLVWLVRKPRAIVRRKLKLGLQGLRDHSLFLACAALYPLSACAEALVTGLAAMEWTRGRPSKGGSEMYVFLRRAL